MRNVTLPTVSSQLYYLGNNEVRMPDFGALNTMSVNRRPFCFETNFPDAGNQLMHEGFTLPYESFNNVQAGFQYAPSSFYDTLQQPMIASNNVSVPGNEMDQAMQNRKRSIESTTNIFAKRDVPVAVLTELKKNKRKKAIPTEAQWQNQVLQPESVNIQVHKLHVPVRRSQKLSDKITALQKLVSPYGKTDTASVLQEASLYIKLLQEQIQDLFQMLNSSNNSMSPLHCSQGHDGNLLDLRSRGLCLVPISLIQKAALGRL